MFTVRDAPVPRPTFGACGGGNFSGSGPNVIDDGVLEPGDPGGKGTGIGVRKLRFKGPTIQSLTDTRQSREHRNLISVLVRTHQAMRLCCGNEPPQTPKV